MCAVDLFILLLLLSCSDGQPGSALADVVQMSGQGTTVSAAVSVAVLSACLCHLPNPVKHFQTQIQL